MCLGQFILPLLVTLGVRNVVELQCGFQHSCRQHRIQRQASHERELCDRDG
jgi:hypothetical protein